MGYEDVTYRKPVSPYTTGIACKCPRCGEGDLFDGFLTLQNSCPVCALDYDGADTGDGPAVFLIFIVGFIAIVVVFVARFSYEAPIWLALLLGILVTLGATALMIRPMKAAMIALQFKDFEDIPESQED